jgi:outer membrane immunogenic protein
MTHFRSVFAAGLLLSVTVGTMSAHAADIAPAPDLWTGFYLGAQAGYLWGTGSNTDVCFSVTGEGRQCLGNQQGFNLGDINTDGVTAGGYLGYNYRFDSIVMGLEGDFNWDNAQGDIKGQADMSLNWDASIRARLGFVVDERALLYVTGGPSWIETELDINSCSNIMIPAGNASCGDSNTEFGWQLGAGAEYFVTDNLSVKAEYLHGWYGNADLDVVSGSEGSTKFNEYLKQDLQTNVVRAGVAYHFGGI